MFDPSNDDDDDDDLHFAYLVKQTQHYANTPMQYTAIFHGCINVNFRMIILIFLLKALIVDTR